MRDTDAYGERLEAACASLEKAQAILIGAGAGLSAAAGSPYSGPVFEREFADYIARYGFTDLYSSSFYPFPTPGEYWARWARHIDLIRLRTPALPLYHTLLRLVSGRTWFVITTNVDGQFLKAGFDPERLFMVQGDYGLMQCARGCHPQVYPDGEAVKGMLAATRDFSVPAEALPRCPVCAGPMDVHVRKDRFFVEDPAWEAAAARYEDFLERWGRDRLVLLELGVGFNTPGIIRHPFEKIAARNPQATLIRLNRDDPAGGRGTIAFSEPMQEVLEALLGCGRR